MSKEKKPIKDSPNAVYFSTRELGRQIKIDTRLQQLSKDGWYVGSYETEVGKCFDIISPSGKYFDASGSIIENYDDEVYETIEFDEDDDEYVPVFKSDRNEEELLKASEIHELIKKSVKHKRAWTLNYIFGPTRRVIDPIRERNESRQDIVSAR